jgi:hypothetical protein
VVRRTIERVLTALALVGCAGCSSNGDSSSTDPPCVTGLDAGCAATNDPPTYDTIYTSILVPNCAVGTGTCHTSDFAPDGLVFADETTSYDTLLGLDGGTPLVLPGNPGCSTLMKRLESTDPDYHMPKGPSFLSAGDLCTIVQWISQGAPQ